MLLKTETLDVIKGDKVLRAKLEKLLNVTPRMMNNYLNNNTERFTTLDAINTIVIHTERPLSTLIDGKVSKLLCK
jgi:LPS O-antigen subunit length determinant protein (WzzB/FepE family)